MIVAPSGAQDAQGYSNELDAQLLQLVRASRPRARWWWGRRNFVVKAQDIPDREWLAEGTKDDDQVNAYGAWCYVCERFIATWAHRWPMPEQARARIGLHRIGHVQMILGAGPTEE